MFQNSTNAAQIRLLADAFLACPIGETISYSALSSALGFSVHDRFYLVPQAIALANKEAGALFRNVRMEGYRRLPPGNAHQIGKDTRGKIRRAAGRAGKAIANALDKANDISNSDRIKAFREQVSLGILKHCSYDRNLPPEPATAVPPPVSLTARKTVEAMRAALSRND